MFVSNVNQLNDIFVEIHYTYYVILTFFTK